MTQFLKIRNNPINLFNIARLKKEFKIFRKDLLSINEEWENVQKLNYLAHYLCQKYESESKNIAENILNNLDVLAKDFSFHFSVVYKFLEKINKEIVDKKIQYFFEEFKKKFEYKIQVFHNQVIKQREKPNFRNTLVYSFVSTFSFCALTKNGEFKIDPFIDAKEIENYLLKLKRVIEK